VRERLHDLDEALDHHVGPATVIPGDAADNDAERKADRDADQPDGQRNPRAIDDARHEVTAEPVGAEQEQLPVLGRADEMEARRGEAPEQVLVAVAEEPERVVLVRVRGVDPVQVVHVEAVVVALDIRGDEAARVEEAHVLRRRVDKIGVARV
jgi:hypothetical protein